MGLARPMFFIVFDVLPGPGTSPIQFVSEVYAILEYLCVRSSDVVSKLALGQFVFYIEKPKNLPGHQIFVHPEFRSKPKSHPTLFGARHIKYQPEMISLDLFAAKKHVFVAKH